MPAGKPLAVSPALRSKVHALRDYGLTLKAIAIRLSLAVSTIHKILNP